MSFIRPLSREVKVSGKQNVKRLLESRHTAGSVRCRKKSRTRQGRAGHDKGRAGHGGAGQGKAAYARER